MVAPKLFPSFSKYAFRYCDPKPGWRGQGWRFDGATNIEELHERVKSVMIRRTKAEVLKELPPKVRSVLRVPIANRKEYDRARTDFITWVKSTQGQKAADSARRAEALVRLGALKQIAAQGKLGSILQWTRDWLEETGEKLVIFGVHRVILDTLAQELPESAVVHGGTAQNVRERNILTFQTDPRCRVFIGSIKAAGVGLTLTASSTVLFAELGWTPAEHDQAEDRVHRIGQTSDSVMIHYIVGEETIEQHIVEMIERKRDVLSRVLDGKRTSTRSCVSSSIAACWNESE
jgi:SWI/SNF-related matrix-associated actin-dependent regulator 1 of chromatin subfamily A